MCKGKCALSDMDITSIKNSLINILYSTANRIVKDEPIHNSLIVVLPDIANILMTRFGVCNNEDFAMKTRVVKPRPIKDQYRIQFPSERVDQWHDEDCTKHNASEG